MADSDSPAVLIEMKDMKRRGSGSGNGNNKGSPSATTGLVHTPNQIATTEIITPSVARKTPRDLRNKRVVFTWLPTLGFVSDYLHGAWWFVWGSVVSTIFPIPPLIDTYVGGALFRGTQSKNSTQTFFEVETSWWSLIAMGIFFTIGSLIFARPYYDPPRPQLFDLKKGSKKNDDILAAWMFFIASLPSLGYVASFLWSDFYSVMYWGMTFAAIMFVILSAVFLYYSYQDEFAETNMLLKLLVVIFGKKNWIATHCDNDILVSLWICFWGSLVVTIGSFMYTAWQLWISGPAIEVYTCAIGGFDTLIFTIGFAYFLSATYIKEVKLNSPVH